MTLITNKWFSDRLYARLTDGPLVVWKTLYLRREKPTPYEEPHWSNHSTHQIHYSWKPGWNPASTLSWWNRAITAEPLFEHRHYNPKRRFRPRVIGSRALHVFTQEPQSEGAPRALCMLAAVPFLAHREHFIAAGHPVITAGYQLLGPMLLNQRFPVHAVFSKLWLDPNVHNLLAKGQISFPTTQEPWDPYAEA